MEISWIWTAFILGLTTGLHCIGMCGPIAFTIGINRKSKFLSVVQNIAYQLGRVVTYSLMGFFAGWIGKLFYIAHWQQYLSIIVGVLMILMIVFSGNSFSVGANSTIIQKLYGKVKNGLGSYMQKKDTFSRFITGIINGFLPCGPVYMALTFSIAMGSVSKSTLYMAFFGLGTMPMMFLAVYTSQMISVKWRNKILKLYPYFIVILGVILILRGLNLGIPLLSPPIEKLQVGDSIQHSCH